MFDFRGKLFKTVDFNNWAIAYSKHGEDSNDINDCRNLFHIFKNICSQYGIKIGAQPGLILTGNTLQHWKNAIKKDADKYGAPQILLLFLKDEELSLYPSLTKYIVTELKFPTHLVNRNLVAPSNKKPHHLAADIILQM